MLPQNKIYYLCGPFTGETERNLSMINKVASELMLQGYTVFSPVSHGAMIMQGMRPDKVHEYISNDNWDKINLSVLKTVCDAVIVIQTNDHRTQNSRGIKVEVDFARKCGKDIVYITEDCTVINKDTYQPQVFHHEQNLRQSGPSL